MPNKAKKEVKAAVKYKAVDPDTFKESYTDLVPFYEELSNGEAVSLSKKNKYFTIWLNNNIIIKE
tara:strand:- start:625 stop:819 length:195 start_codon:yes stop_codon:yes gene_type:complete